MSRETSCTTSRDVADGDRNANKSFADHRVVTGDPPCSSPRRRVPRDILRDLVMWLAPHLRTVQTEDVGGIRRDRARSDRALSCGGPVGPSPLRTVQTEDVADQEGRGPFMWSPVST
jgi:hypothetical protein